MKLSKYAEEIYNAMQEDYIKFSRRMDKNEVFKASIHGYAINSLVDVINNAYERGLINHEERIYLSKELVIYLKNIMNSLYGKRIEGENNA